MTTPSSIADRAALTRNRTRACRTGPALYLHDAAACEIKERLDEVNKAFQSTAVVTGFPDFWQGTFPSAKVIADDETLELQAGAHDLILHALALHWADDPVGQLIQCRRALRPDGLMICAMFAGRTLRELRTVLAEAEVNLTAGLSARVLPMGEIRDLGGLLQRAGFALPVADLVPVTASFRNLRHLASDLRAMGEGNALRHRSRQHAADRSMFETADRLYAEHFPAGDGRILATFETVYLSGWAPAAGQQVPLRPGSAVSRLADALGATETGLGPVEGAGRD